MEYSTCPICYIEVPSLQIERHANNHFDDEECAKDLQFAEALAIASPSSRLFVPNVSQHAGDYCDNPEGSSLGCDTKTAVIGGKTTDEKFYDLVNKQVEARFYRVEKGLMDLLRNCLELDSKNFISILAGYVDHFQSTESEDFGWGCGWRNIQMLSSHLLKQRNESREVLYGGSGFVPDIASLQRWLELAWERGFDTLGSYDFDQEIFGKRIWIGTTECAALFRSFGLRARIVDFCSKEMVTLTAGSSCGTHKMDKVMGKRKVEQVYGPMDKFLSKGNPNASEVVFSRHENYSYSTILPDNMKGQQVLIDWVWNYFSGNRSTNSSNQSVILSEKPPLYFQHDGHSRTIVGIQATNQKNGTQNYNLLVFDPGEKTAALEKSLEDNTGWQKLIKRGVHTLKKPQYQLCFIDPGIACGEEMEMLKTLHSIRLEF